MYDKTWTLFLDRDGVINEEIKGGYVTQWNEFKFYNQVKEALAELNCIFGTIIIVTNQRGVGKNIMTMDNLKAIHHNMNEEIIEAGGKIARIYACVALKDDDHNRKPNIGMALQAQQDFEHIDFKKSVMVGNNISDMQFGKRSGMKTVFLTTTNPPVQLPHELIDEQYSSLHLFTHSLVNQTVIIRPLQDKLLYKQL